LSFRRASEARQEESDTFARAPPVAPDLTRRIGEAKDRGSDEPGNRRIGKGTTSSRAAKVATIQAASAAEDRTSYHHDGRVAKLKLESMGIKIDRLTPEQEEYLAGWSEGT
jgi:hypothetical protein